MSKAIFSLLLLFLINFVSASQIEFSEYEVDKISSLMSKECQIVSFLICTNQGYTFIYEDNITFLNNKDCIDFDDSKLKEGVIPLGRFQKLYNGQAVDLSYEGKDKKLNSFWISIEEPRKEEIIKYLEYRNALSANTLGDHMVGFCQTNDEKIKELVINQYNQKYWGKI